MWQNFEQAAERAATDRARRAVQTAFRIRYEEEPFDDDQQPQQRHEPALSNLGEQVRYFFYSTILPFIIWIIKACLILFSILVLSIGTYAIIWNLIMQGLDVKSRPIFFDYNHDESIMPTGIVDMRSTKSAPWVHACVESTSSNSNAHNVCINYDNNMMSYTNKAVAGDSNKVIDEKDVSSNQDSILTSGQRYFFELSLTLPESEINKQLGVFMVNVHLKSADRTLLATSKQHSMLPYESTLVSLFRKTMLILPLASGLLSETRTITLLSFDHYIDANNKKPMSMVEVSLGVANPAAFPSTLQTIQIHSAEIRYGKEMNAIQTILRNWKYSCAFWGSTILFLIYTCITLSILHRRARRIKWKTQPYADFFSSSTVEESANNNNNNNNSEANDRWMGVDIEILSENDYDAWEPLDNNDKEKNGKSEDGKKKTSPDNNLVSDDDNESISSKLKSKKSNTTSTFPLGKLADDEAVANHEPLFPSKSSKDKTAEHKSSAANSEEEAKKKMSTQQKEERDMADMVMKGHSKYEIFTGER